MTRIALVLLLAGTSAAAQPPPPRPDTLAGTVVLPGGVALSRGSRVEVALLDLDGLERLGSVTLGVAGRSGDVPFALGYDVRDLRPRVRYALRAEVRDGDDRMLYESASVRVRFDRRGVPDGPTRIPLGPAADPGAGVVSASGPPPPDVATSGTVTGSVAGGTLMNETWRLTEAVPTGAAARPAGPGYTLVFRGSHTYSGEAGCARFFGRYETSESGGLTLSPATVTRAGCPAGSASADPVLGVLAGVTRFEGDGRRLALAGSAGRLAFERVVRARTSSVIPQVDWLSEYACGDAGTFLLRTGRGDAEVWLSDALAARHARGAPLGTYHVLGQVPAEGVARFQDGPLAAVVDGEGVQGETAGLEIGPERLRCTARPDPDMSVYGGRVNSLPDIRAEGWDWMVEMYGTAGRSVYLSFWDGVSLFGSPATVTVPAPGVTEIRGEYGVVVTVTAGACADGSDRVRLARPEGTSDGCRMVIN